MSTDGGKTVNTDAASTIHDDIHAIWIDPANSNHVIIGNDGGLASRCDQAKTWNFVPNLPVGLFYHVSYDMATPFNVCGGMQDNYDWCGPSAGARRGRHRQLRLVDDAGRRRLRRAAGSERLPHRLQRVAGRQHRPHRSRHRRDDVDPAAGRPPASRALRWHWDTPMMHVAARSEGRLRRRRNKVFRVDRPRPDLDADQPRPHGERQPRATSSRWA